MEHSEQVQWKRQPEAERFVVNLLNQFEAYMPPFRRLGALLMVRTGSRLADWVDHLVLADGDRPAGELAALGFEVEEVAARRGDRVYHHPGAILPRVLIRAGTDTPPGSVQAVALQVESVSAFQMAHRISSHIEGSPLGPYRCGAAWRVDGREVAVVERRGHAGFVPVDMPPDHAGRWLRSFERWATRQRTFEDELEGMRHTLALAQALVGELGVDSAAWAAFAAERAYWQQRNRAGQVQKERQDSLGLGWANHDHQAFRSSRRPFPGSSGSWKSLAFIRGSGFMPAPKRAGALR